MLTRQEIFNKAWIGMKAQGFKKSLRGTACRYRGPNGLKCAIGHLMPDEAYRRRFENHAPFEDEAVGRAILKACNIAFADGEFARSLQGCHDIATTEHNMAEKLAAFAASYNLTIPGEAA